MKPLLSKEHPEFVVVELGRPLSLHKVVAQTGFGPVIRFTILALNAIGSVVDFDFRF